MVLQYLEVVCAKSNRVRCLECDQPIKKEELKIGHVFHRRQEGNGYDKKLWYHLNCLKKIIRNERNQELEINNLYQLSDDQQKQVQDKLNQLRSLEDSKKNKKQDKFQIKSEFYLKFQGRKTFSSRLPKRKK